jgi:hypothetical protein
VLSGGVFAKGFDLGKLDWVDGTASEVLGRRFMTLFVIYESMNL